MLVTNIQRFSLHDGPGIRTTVFLKGCSLRCPWCSNPENLSPSVQKYIKDGKEGIYGVQYTADALYDEVIKDRAFYIGDITDYNITRPEQLNHLPGGVTFSGGECLLQMNELSPLLTRLNQEHIHTAVESCLFVPPKYLELALQKVDLFYADVKILDAQECRIILHGELPQFFSNLDRLLHSGKPVVLRVPVIGGYTDGVENRALVSNLIASCVANPSANLLKVELIQEHNLGISKYQALSTCNEGYEAPAFRGVTRKLMEQYKASLLQQTGRQIPVEICCV